MTELKPPKTPIDNWEAIRDEWMFQVRDLIGLVESWCRLKNWPTRRVEKRMEDTRIGEYLLPALIFQVDVSQFLLEPIARFTAAVSDGALQLCLMPGYETSAYVIRVNNEWLINLTEVRPEDDVNATMSKYVPLTQESFEQATVQFR